MFVVVDGGSGRPSSRPTSTTRDISTNSRYTAIGTTRSSSSPTSTTRDISTNSNRYTARGTTRPSSPTSTTRTTTDAQLEAPPGTSARTTTGTQLEAPPGPAVPQATPGKSVTCSSCCPPSSWLKQYSPLVNYWYIVGDCVCPVPAATHPLFDCDVTVLQFSSQRSSLLIRLY